MSFRIVFGAAWLGAIIVASGPSSPAQAVSLVGVRSIGWGDTLGPGSGDLDLDCQNPTAHTLVASFHVPTLAGPVYGLEAAVDFCTMPHPLPDWWQVTEPGGCREGGMTVSADFSTGPFSHQDFFAGRATTDVVFITNHMGDADRARIAVTVLMDPADSTPLTPGVEYYAFRIDFSVPAAPCDGCGFPACFAFNGLRLLHEGGETDVWGDGYTSFARWQGGQGDCPFIVSVEEGSWGAVKALYR